MMRCTATAALQGAGLETPTGIWGRLCKGTTVDLSICRPLAETDICMRCIMKSAAASLETSSLQRHRALKVGHDGRILSTNSLEGTP